MNDPAIQHFNYDELDIQLCTCDLCVAVRLRTAQATQAAEASAHHPHRCRCKVCRGAHMARRALMASSNRRDVYSELSFLVRNRTWRKEFLAWVLAATRDPKVADTWWIDRAETKALSVWIAEAIRAGVIPRTPAIPHG